MAKERFVSLDCLRGVAALIVAIFHARPFFGQVAPGGYLAVDVFFALSGFVIAHNYETRLRMGMSVGEFMRVRWIRFFPLHLLGMIIGCILAAALLVTHSPSALADPQTVVLLFLLGVMFIPSPLGGDIFPLNVPAWSLFYELAVNLFYAMGMKRITSRVLYVVALLSFMGFAVLALATSKTESGPLLNQVPAALLRTIFSFCAGVIIYRWRRSLPLNPLPWIILVAVALLIPLPEAYRVPYDLACIGAFFPLCLWIIAGCEKTPFPQFMEMAGKISFPLYAIHWPLIWLVYGVAQRLSLPLAIAGSIAILGAIVASILLDRYYDEPARSWLRARLLSVRQPG